MSLLLYVLVYYNSRIIIILIKYYYLLLLLVLLLIRCIFNDTPTHTDVNVSHDTVSTHYTRVVLLSLNIATMRQPADYQRVRTYNNNNITTMCVFVELENECKKKICQKTTIWNTATGKTNIWRKLTSATGPHYTSIPADQTTEDQIRLCSSTSILV